MIGAHADLDALRKAATGANALTFDHEHVPTEMLDTLVDEGVNVAPPPEALVHAQDRLVMRRKLEALGPRYPASPPRKLSTTWTRSPRGPFRRDQDRS